MYINLTNTFPTQGPAQPQPMSGRGTTTVSIGPYFLHSSAMSFQRSSTNYQSQRSSGQHMFKNCKTLLGTLQAISDLRVICMSKLVIFSQERRQDPKAWLAGFETVSRSPEIFVAFGVQPKESALLPRLAEWHFSLLLAIGKLLRAFIAFSPYRCSSYYKKQYPLETPPSRTKLKNFNFPNVSHIFLTCSSLKDRGSPPRYILLSSPSAFSSFFFMYFSWKNYFGRTILNVVPYKQLNQGCVLKKSLTLLEARLIIAKVLALSPNATSLIGSGMASQGLEAAITVLKY